MGNNSALKNTERSKKVGHRMHIIIMLDDRCPLLVPGHMSDARQNWLLDDFLGRRHVFPAKISRIFLSKRVWTRSAKVKQ
jgi:hypothetical protein